jgi:hypothetical protein
MPTALSTRFQQLLVHTGMALLPAGSNSLSPVQSGEHSRLSLLSSEITPPY